MFMVMESLAPSHLSEAIISASSVSTARDAMSATTSLVSRSCWALVMSRTFAQASSASSVVMVCSSVLSALISSTMDTPSASAKGSMFPMSGKPTPRSQRLMALSVT